MLDAVVLSSGQLFGGLPIEPFLFYNINISFLHVTCAC